MMIKANGEYLDFNGDVEIESQIKLFEEISTSNGDFSYDIDIQDNGQNRKTLGIPRADTVKSIYQEVPSEIIDDTGQSIYTGKLQVNRIQGGFINATFYAGNTEWFALLSEPMSSLPLYRYDVDLTEANIQASWLDDSGIVFPIVDAGVLVTRAYSNLKVEDFTSAFYVKTLFNEIFNPQGIKLQGDLIDDPIYKKLVVYSNGRSQDSVNDRSCYVNKTVTQTGITTPQKITFEDETSNPFFDGAMGNFSSSAYVADAKMRLKITPTMQAVLTGVSFFSVYVYINGVQSQLLIFTTIANSKTFDVDLEKGDYAEIYVRASFGGTVDILLGSTLKITPVFIYRTFGNSSVPAWTQGEFVSNILRLFNVLPSYNTNTKTLTLDLFNKIKEKEPVNISDQVVINSVDFSEFVSNYAKSNIFSYQESDDEDLREYNISNFISYGSGELLIDNAYIENSADLVESDFTSPITYLNGVFDMSMERFNFVQLEEIETKDITSVTDSSGTPRFNISNADDTFLVGDLVRIEDSNIETYNGDWVVSVVTSSYIEVNGGIFDSSGTGTARLMRHKFTSDDNVYLFVNIPNVTVPTFSSKTELLLEDATTFSTTAIAYFSMLSNATSINKIYKQSLSFGSVNNPLSYQVTLLDTYWPLFSKVLNNPVMLGASGYLKRTTFDNMKSFLRPIRIDTEETTNLYYLNRNRGYKGSERECELELIKLN